MCNMGEERRSQDEQLIVVIECSKIEHQMNRSVVCN